MASSFPSPTERDVGGTDKKRVLAVLEASDAPFLQQHVPQRGTLVSFVDRRREKSALTLSRFEVVGSFTAVRSSTAIRGGPTVHQDNDDDAELVQFWVTQVALSDKFSTRSSGNSISAEAAATTNTTCNSDSGDGQATVSCDMSSSSSLGNVLWHVVTRLQWCPPAEASAICHVPLGAAPLLTRPVMKSLNAPQGADTPAPLLGGYLDFWPVLHSPADEGTDRGASPRRCFHVLSTSRGGRLNGRSARGVISSSFVQRLLSSAAFRKLMATVAPRVSSPSFPVFDFDNDDDVGSADCRDECGEGSSSLEKRPLLRSRLVAPPLPCGGDCTAAAALRFASLRTMSYPLDWVRSTPASIARLLLRDDEEDPSWRREVFSASSSVDVVHTRGTNDYFGIEGSRPEGAEQETFVYDPVNGLLSPKGDVVDKCQRRIRRLTKILDQHEHHHDIDDEDYAAPGGPSATGTGNRDGAGRDLLVALHIGHVDHGTASMSFRVDGANELLKQHPRLLRLGLPSTVPPHDDAGADEVAASVESLCVLARTLARRCAASSCSGAADGGAVKGGEGKKEHGHVVVLLLAVNVAPTNFCLVLDEDGDGEAESDATAVVVHVCLSSTHNATVVSHSTSSWDNVAKRTADELLAPLFDE